MRRRNLKMGKEKEINVHKICKQIKDKHEKDWKKYTKEDGRRKKTIKKGDIR